MTLASLGAIWAIFKEAFRNGKLFQIMGPEQMNFRNNQFIGNILELEGRAFRTGRTLNMCQNLAKKVLIFYNNK